MYNSKIISKTKKTKPKKTHEEYEEDYDKSYNSEVKVEKNHIYMYCDINSKTIYEMISAINKLNFDMQVMKLDINVSHGIELEPVIYLHINSYGGYLYDGFLGADYIVNSKIKIISIIDGYCASSATLLSMCCQERWINKNSSILIHQLRSGHWGKFSEIEEHYKNSKKAQKKLSNFYKRYTKLSKEEINNWLNKDIEFNSKKSLKMGFVDRII